MIKIVFDNNDYCQQLYGFRESHLKVLEKGLNVSLLSRGNELTIKGPKEKILLAKKLLEELYLSVKSGNNMTPDYVKRIVNDALKSGDDQRVNELLSDIIITTYRNKRIRPISLNQKRYVDAIRKNDLVFGIGPAGTGKTYLAVAMAISMFNRKVIDRIILTRPAVEAGERLGFLPGTLQEKISPYLRPLYDALQEIVGIDKLEHLISRGQIEVAPLAFMRGRTLNGAFIILDEAQNTTSEQMKMFLTRLGSDSKAVVTGDITQNDLPKGVRSGLEESERILKNIEGIEFCHFDESDVVRHPLVQRIIRAYAEDRERQYPKASEADSED